MGINLFGISVKRDIHNISKISLVLLIVGYLISTLGSPMPSSFSFIEIASGSFLFVGGIFSLPIIISEIRQSLLLLCAATIMVFLCFLPLTVGILSGNNDHDVLRDLIPFIFIVGVPFIFCTLGMQLDKLALEKIILSVLLWSGLIAGLTFIYGVYSITGSLADVINMMRRGFAGLSTLPGSLNPANTPSSLAVLQDQVNQLEQFFLKIYDPALLVAAIYFCIFGLRKIIYSRTEALMGLCFFVVGITLAYIFMIMGLRAYTLAILLAIIFICIVNIKESGLYTRVAPLAFLLLFLYSNKIRMIFELLSAKQRLMGSNGKLDEWGAVFARVGSHYESIFFGIGWGGLLENPIFLGENSRFTHSMISFYLLKAGILGLALLLLFFYFLFMYLKKGYKAPILLTNNQTLILISTTPALLIGIFFQPTYKMLSFGIILSLLLLVVSQLKLNKN